MLEHMSERILFLEDDEIKSIQNTVAWKKMVDVHT